MLQVLRGCKRAVFFVTIPRFGEEFIEEDWLNQEVLLPTYPVQIPWLQPSRDTPFNDRLKKSAE